MSASTNLPPLESSQTAPRCLTNAGRMLMLITAFLGWLCAGFLLSITSAALQPAAIDLLSRTGQLDRASYFDVSARSKQKPGNGVARQLPHSRTRNALNFSEAHIIVGEWVAWLKCAFLFGAAFGGLCFGALGDRFGRTKGMGLAILTYSAMSGIAFFSERPVDLLVCWFLACTGVGGMWPNGVALVAEAWSNLSRTASAGIIGAAANIGIYLMSSLMMYYPPVPRGMGESVGQMMSVADRLPPIFHRWSKLTPVPTDWRWVMVVASIPAVLGIFSLIAVPESPLWLASRGKSMQKPGSSGGNS